MPFIYKRSFDQDRLGTNIGKALKKECGWVGVAYHRAHQGLAGRAQPLVPAAEATAAAVASSISCIRYSGWIVSRANSIGSKGTGLRPESPRACRQAWHGRLLAC